MAHLLGRVGCFCWFLCKVEELGANLKRLVRGMIARGMVRRMVRRMVRGGIDPYGARGLLLLVPLKEWKSWVQT